MFPLVLNELSHGPLLANRDAVVECVTTFSRSLRAIRLLRETSFLLSSTRLPEVALEEGSSLQSLLGDRRVREEILFLFSLINRAPFSLIEQEIVVDMDASECSHEGHAAIGFLYCIFAGGLAVSFPSSESWLSTSATVQFSRLTDDGSVDVGDVIVPHISLPAHVDSHLILLVPGVNVPVDGEEIWRRRGELLPGIDFLPRVEAQLALYAKGMPETFQIIARLMEMQASISMWDSGVDPQPNWATKITGESESRRKKCYFNASSGESILYEMHARFTPGAGRIYFRVVREQSRIEIAQIGPKLM